MIPIVIYNFRPLRGSTTYGMAIWPFIFLQFSREEHLSDPRKRETLKHELVHIYQTYRYWIVGFPFVYGWEWIRRGYVENRFEAEARAVARREPLTEAELKIFL